MSLLPTQTQFWCIWLPIESANAAEVQRFLSIAAGPATAHLINLFGAKLNHAQAIGTANIILGKLEKHLKNREWLANQHPTLADLANYAYIDHAPEADISLEPYSNVKAWLQRIETLPGFLPMPTSAVGLSAP